MLICGWLSTRRKFAVACRAVYRRPAIDAERAPPIDGAGRGSPAATIAPMPDTATAPPAATERALEILQHVFGYRSFRGAQRDIVEHVIGGGDALVLMPTGGGKSLCYQIPALVRAGAGVVVSPLIALMQDQVDALRQAGVRAAFLNSTLDGSAAREVEREFAAGRLDLLYVAPERALTERFLALLGRAPLALFAIDEAHCVSQWGHDFRPEYIRLSVLHERFPRVPRVALTATADALTRREIVERLGLDDARQFVSSFDRPNIRYRVVEKDGAREQLARFVRDGHAGAAGIVYCQSRRRVEDTARWLAGLGVEALPYHAGLDADTRRRNQQRFLREDGVVMVATVAFGMGIDKPDVRYVAHLDLPQSLEGYYQETGRAGRDGAPAEAWLAYGLSDVVLLRNRIDGSAAPDEVKRIERHKLDAMLGYCETTSCRRQVLLDYFGEASVACGNCDTCLDPPRTVDGTVAAQKLLSAALRTGQRYGAGHLIDLLLGKSTPRMTELGHDRLPTFGVGTEFDAAGWRALVRHLVASGYLHADADRYGALGLAGNARALLKGEVRVSLRRPARPAAPRRTRAAAAKDAMQPAGVDSALLDALRACRRRLAQQQGVPPYVVFHDTTLVEMALLRPATLAGLRELTGVGDTKLARYGAAFLEVLGGAR
jgi:ATP-dependent DNA helicase RecQ